ncbi:MAG: HWE histidine kinase domain-containing protein [Reyranella sp.]
MPASEPVPRARGWRLATLLFLFGATLIVPSILANGLLLQRQAGLQQRDIERRVEQVAADLIDGIERELALMEAMATVMAASPDLAAGRLEQFHVWATQLLQRLGLNVLYRDLDGQQLLNTRVSFGTALPREILPEIDAAVRATLKPYVSDMLVGAVRRNFVITVTAPVVVDGALRGFLHFSIDPERMLGLMKAQKLPPEWNTILADRKGVVIARLQQHEKFVGMPLPASLRGNVDGAVVRSVNLEGVEMLRGSRISPVSGWTVAVGVPVSMVRAQFVANLWSIAGAGIFLGLLTLVLAVMVARVIAGPIRQIAGFATALINGDMTPPLSSPVREANEVAAAFRLASERLNARTRELRETLARFNAALHGADIVVFVQGPDRRITWISESAGYRARNFVGKREEDLVDGLEERAKAIALREKVFATGQPQEGELTTGVGEAARNFRQRLQAIRDSSGDIVGVLGVSVEVTALRREQSRNTMLVRELAHRSKNLLAVVQAIAGETLRSAGADDFMDRFGARLQSLALLQDLVVSGARGGVELGQLVRTQLAPFAEPGKRLEIAGPEVRLRPEAANMLGMALHELATNATKYGCLSVPEGAVLIAWRLQPDTDGAQRFRLTWRESGGPPVAKPAQGGFGSRVVIDMTAATLGGRVSLDYLPDGVVWQVDAPATIVMD